MRQRRSRRHRSILAKLNAGVLPIAAVLVLNRGQFARASTPATWEGVASDYLWTSPTNWSINAAPPTASPYDDLIFGNGTPGTISLGANQFANSLTFSNDGFTLDAPASTHTLTDSTGTISVGSSATATINAILTGNGGLTVTGTGSLLLNAADTYAGGTVISGSTLTTGNGSALNTAAQLTVSAAGSVVINANTTFALGSGVSNSGKFTINSPDTFTFNTTGAVFTQTTGTLTVSGTLNTAGSGFTYNGGTIVGTVQIGTTTFAPSLTFGSGAGNSGTFIIGGKGVTFSAVSSGIQSNQTVTLQPTASAGAMALSANLSNVGNLVVNGSSTSTATVSMSTHTLANSGTLTTTSSDSPTSAVDFFTAVLNNTTGTVNINALTSLVGSITNSSAFTIASTGSLTMPGTGGAATAFTQTSGTLTINSSLDLTGSSFNDNGGTLTGTVTIGSPSTATLGVTFGASAGNSGTILFTGEGGTDTGSVPTGVTLTLQPTATSGGLSLPSGFVNNGTMNLIGSATSTATFTANSTLTNSGILTTTNTSSPTTANQFIVGTLNNTNAGTVNVNASLAVQGTVNNNGTIDVASGATLTVTTAGPTFNQNAGQVTVAAGGTLDVTPGTLTINNGTITLNAGAASQGVLKLGTAQFTGSNTTGTIASGAVGGGQTPGHVDLAGSTPTLTIGSGSQPAQVIISAPITDGGLSKTGLGTLELSGANTYSLGTTVTAGTLLIAPTGGAASALPTGALSVSGSGLVQLADNVTAGTPLATSNVNITSLSLTGTGALDIGNNRVIIDYTGSDPIASIETWINSGYYGLPGPAIISSDVTTDDSSTGFSYGIGYADGADGAVAGLPSGEIEIMFTLLGDANLDGQVNSEDFTPISHNLNQPGVWDQGDFNYDGTVNSEDFTPFSHNLNQSASLAAAAGALDVANGISLTNVPEPGCAVISAIAAFGLLQPRLRSRRRNPSICKSDAGA